MLGCGGGCVSNGGDFMTEGVKHLWQRLLVHMICFRVCYVNILRDNDCWCLYPYKRDLIVCL